MARSSRKKLRRSNKSRGVALEDKKKVLKEAVQQLHAGVPPEQVKERFRHFLEGVNLLEIAEIEQQLINEGLSREEIQRLCDVHLAIFREQLETRKIELAAGSSINILLEEHETLQKLTEKLNTFAEEVQKAKT